MYTMVLEIIIGVLLIILVLQADVQPFVSARPIGQETTGINPISLSSGENNIDEVIYSSGRTADADVDAKVSEMHPREVIGAGRAKKPHYNYAANIIITPRDYAFEGAVCEADTVLRSAPAREYTARNGYIYKVTALCG
jgi:hypothetical protein